MTDSDHAKLYGRSAEEGIVDVAMTSKEPCEITVWKRDGDSVTSYTEDHDPYLLMKDPAHLKGFLGRCRTQELAGDLAYQTVAFFENWGAMWGAESHIEKQSGGMMNPVYMITDPAKQYLMRTGKTLFGGMKPEDVKVLSFDIEAYSLEGFPQADNPDHDVFIISMATRDEEWLLHTGPQGMGHALPNEKVLLEQFVKAVQEIDPDVLAGHNFLGFDLPYLRDRCKLYDIAFEIGRGDTVPDTYTSGQRFAERDVEFEAFRVDGRHTIDTYLQALSFDVFARDLPGYGLKTVAKYFGFADEDRTYVDGDKISEVWDSDPERILRYAMDDAREALSLYGHLSNSDFYLSQILPMRYGDVARCGTAEQIETLMTREYLREGHSLPTYDLGSMEAGGYTDCFHTGVYGPVCYADVESLYPRIMLDWNCDPGDKDPLGLFSQLLEALTDMRFEAKHEMKRLRDELKKERDPAKAQRESELDGRQSSYKVLINSFYGALAFKLFLWNNFDEADRVTRTGRELLRKMKRLIEDDGGKAIEADTDGIIFVPPAHINSEPGATEDKEYVEGLTESMPRGIKIGFDGRAKAMVSYKKKNYALLGYDDKLKVKGGSFKARSGVSFKRELVSLLLEALSRKNVTGMNEAYEEVRGQIMNRTLPASALSRTSTLKDVAEYEEKIARGERNKDAAYEIAGENAKAGDRITYYVAGGEGRVYERAKLLSEYAGDEDQAYYLEHLEKTAEKFADFFSPADFDAVFPSGGGGLFAKDLSEVEVLNRKVEKEEIVDTPF